MLSKALSRRYALGMRRAEMGIWGYRPSLFRSLHVTTRAGDDNSFERLRRDLRRLFDYWRKERGYDVEFFGGMGYSPINGLAHFHGLLRIKGGYFRVSNHQLHDKWHEIHGAFEGVIEPTFSAEDKEALVKYVTQHILKDIFASKCGEDLFVMSRGWLPHGWAWFQKLLIAWWSGGHGGFTMTDSDWNGVKRAMRLWCEEGTFVVPGRYGYLKVVNRESFERVGTGFYRKG